MIALVGVVVLILLLAILIGLFRSATRSARFNGIGPTPEEARIKQDGDDLQERIRRQAAADESEVNNAKGDKLLALARDRLFKRK